MNVFDETRNNTIIERTTDVSGEIKANDADISNAYEPVTEELDNPVDISEETENETMEVNNEQINENMTTQNPTVEEDPDYYNRMGLREHNEKLDTYEYAMSKNRNHEFYPDPTFHKARRNIQRQSYQPKYQSYQPWRPNIDNRNEIRENNAEPFTNIPVYTGRKSRQYETVGVIIRLLDLAGFRLGSRLVLVDKETGEVLE